MKIRMVALRRKQIVAILLIVPFMFFLVIPKLRRAGIELCVWNGSRANWQDIADLFVPPGRFYHPEDGIVYHCLTGAHYELTAAPKRVTDFSSGGWEVLKAEDDKERKKSFVSIFEEQTWLANRTPNITKMSLEYKVSGHGSTLVAAQPPLALLNSVVDRLKIYLQKPTITMVDVPCGDFNWMREFVQYRQDVMYTGIDIVPNLIQRHKLIFSSLPNVQFKNLDIVKDGLNQSFDIIFSRDMLQHLTNADSMKVLDQFSKSGSTLLVTTNLISGSRNMDLDPVNSPGRYRHLNLRLPPINLVPPICSIKDNYDNAFKYLSIWKLPLVQEN